MTMISEVVSLFACIIVVSMAWQNDYNRNLEFICPTGQSITRIQSKHDDHHEDRLWHFSCSNRGNLGQCRWFYNLNEFDGQLFFQCPNLGHIVATRSYHNNYHEDRRFSFQCCTPQTGIRTECRFTSFVNHLDGRMDYNVPTDKYLRGAYSEHRSHEEDRIWRFEECNL
ncbi:hypothetical protein SNE40_016086 [Patella caerulea]|uniref:Dermatopontin n=1 Tax=Patella caerulea TaxID=87958 RepID=A0AAN8PCL4_PATCE